ncbi:hypothetical protein EVA_06845 [gut metagenome]|uniref:Uncharacterized protein n=1 Tax=gut metagenome TaxID=749906 RepID=J9CXT2_9ZZZZ
MAELVYFGGFSFDVGDDFLLLIYGRDRNRALSYIIPTGTWHFCPIGRSINIHY